MEDIQLLVQPASTFPFIGVDTSLAEARARVGNLDEQSLIVIGMPDTPFPCTLVEKAALVALEGGENQTLATLVDQLPRPVFMSDGQIEDLSDIADLLATYRAPGLVLFQHEQMIGIVPITSIVQALSPAQLSISMRKAMNTEQTGISRRTFICRRCEQENPPAYIVELIQGADTPRCGKWPTVHGTQSMEEVKL